MVEPALDEAAIFNAARKIEAGSARREYLQQACGSDAELKTRVEALLRIHDDGQDFLNGTAPWLADLPKERVAHDPGATIAPDLLRQQLGEGASSVAEQEKPDVAITLAPPTAPAPAAEMVAVPGYEILGELGRGGMGVVYKARQIAADRVVALKMILAGSHAGPAELARFKTEAEAVARLQHPHIIGVYEVGEHQGRPFFSLEFCAGGSLDKRLSGTPLPPAEAARVVETLAGAVQAAHDKQVIHRDLKPANVLLAEDGTLKVTDFGLAKKLDEAGQTQSGSVLGTPSYMAPEQAGGHRKEIGPWTDVYALGAILYDCLTGRPPFRAATPLDTLLQVLSDEPVPPRRLQPKTPRDLETICQKCLQKDPKKRYSSARDLAEDLRRFQAGEPIRARPVGPWGRTVKWVRRRPAVAGLLAVCVAALVALAVGGWRYNVQLRQQAHLLEEALGEARKEHDRAQDHLSKALDAVDRMLHPLDDGRLTQLPQFQESRRRMLEEALDFYQGFLRQEGDDPAVRRDSARAYSRSMKLRMLLGEEAEAEQAGREARRLQEQLIADFPDRPEYRYDLASTHATLGHICTLTGRFEQAQQAYHDALALATELVREHPAEAAYREPLVNAQSGLAQDPQGAERLLRQALEHAAFMAEAQPGKAEWQCLLARAHALLGQVLFSTNRVPEAAAELRRARQLLEPAGRAPASAARTYPMVRALTLVYSGGAALRQGHPADAEPLLRDAVAACEELVGSSPRFVGFRIYLQKGYALQAVLYQFTNRPAQAEAAWQKAIECMEQAARISPSFAPIAAAATDDVRLKRWLWALRRGEHSKVMAEVSRLEAQKDLEGPRAYSLACVAAQAAAAVGSDARLADDYARRAVALLVRAEAAGYFRLPGALQQARTAGTALDPLRQRSDFRQLMDRLQKEASEPQADAKPRETRDVR
jgi:tetratricopeptide (TPR) repeat protein